MLTAAIDLLAAARPALGIKADDALKAVLSNGPIASRDALAVLQADGLSAKQVRTARERLGVVVLRTGSGRDMRSTWRLPEPAEIATAHADAMQRPAAEPDDDAEPMPSAAVPVVSDPSQAPQAVAPNARPVLNEYEVARIDRRVSLFTRRGMEQGAANQLAVRLVHERDRPGDPQGGGSCVECESYVRDECIVGPKVLEAIHYCVFMRNDAR